VQRSGQSGEGGKAGARPLAGVTVLDLTQFAAGPYCTMLLADAGARVIKVEPPGGEPYRREGTPLGQASDGSRVASYILRFSRDKESVTLDLKTPDGVAALRALAKSVDVLVQNFKPGTVERLGIDYRTLQAMNPRLVYASVSGFGQRDFLPSPYVDAPAFAVVSEAMGGVMDRLGDDTCAPHWSGVSLGDLFPGGLAVAGILMALVQRERDGIGQHVDISLADAMTSLNEKAILRYLVTGSTPPRGVDEDESAIVLRATGGWVLVVMDGDEDVRRVCARIGASRLPGELPPVGTDGRHRFLVDVVGRAVQDWVGQRDVDAVCRSLRSHCGFVTKVFTARDAVESEHTRARDMLIDVDYGPYGRHLVVNSPIKFSGHSPRRPPRVHLVGEDTGAVLGALALDGVDRPDHG
jgi:CoA:oxalate CoA-transferase